MLKELKLKLPTLNTKKPSLPKIKTPGQMRRDMIAKLAVMKIGK